MSNFAKKIFSNIPYKIKTEKNVDTIYEHLISQGKRYRMFALLNISLWVGYLSLYYFTNYLGNHNLSNTHSVLIFLQIFILPLIAFKLYQQSKKMILTKEEIINQINSMS